MAPPRRAMRPRRPGFSGRGLRTSRRARLASTPSPRSRRGKPRRSRSSTASPRVSSAGSLRGPGPRSSRARLSQRRPRRRVRTISSARSALPPGCVPRCESTSPVGRILSPGDSGGCGFDSPTVPFPDRSRTATKTIPSPTPHTSTTSPGQSKRRGGAVGCWSFARATRSTKAGSGLSGRLVPRPRARWRRPHRNRLRAVSLPLQRARTALTRSEASRSTPPRVKGGPCGAMLAMRLK